MSLIDVTDKENQNPGYELAKKVPEVTSILKPQNLLSFSPSPSHPSKKSGKVSFKNTPERHCPIRFQGEGLALWTDIRKLDEEEHWTERTQVVTKEDHELYLEVARVIIGEIIDSISYTSDSVEDMSSSPSVQGNEDLTISEDEMGQGLVSSVLRRPGHGGSKDRPVSLLEFLGNEKLVEMSEGTGIELKKEVIDKLKILEDKPSTAELEKDLDLEFEKAVSPPKKGSPAAKETNMGATEEADEGEKPTKAMPPKPWLQKKKKAKQGNQDPFVIDFPQLEDSPKVEPSHPAANSEGVGLDEEVVGNNTVEEGAAADNDVGKLPSPQKDCSTSDVDAGLSQEQQQSEEAMEDFVFVDDDFKPADDVFSLELDYLENFGNDGRKNKVSALARQSLYVKFDPLVKGQSPAAGAVGAPNRRLPPSLGDDLLLMNTPPVQQHQSIAARLAVRRLLNDAAAGPLGNTSPQGVDSLLDFSPSKNSTASDALPTEDGESLEGAKELTANESGPHLVQPLLYCKDDVEAAVKREREIVLKQAQEERAIHEMEVQELVQKNGENTVENRRLKEENAELKVVMKEFEKTMSQMIEKEEQSKSASDESHSELIKERDQLQADLNSVESSFADLHRRYEKLKGHVENFKSNEDILKKAAKEYQEKQKKAEEKYHLLKRHAEEKIESANIEIARVRRANESEITAMRAALKMEQSRTASLEQSLQQKINENGELTAICDELISRAAGK